MTKFVYKSYWGTWSRILGQTKFDFVELNLTPIPGSSNKSWETDVKCEKIRVHGTSRNPTEDKVTLNLPSEIREQMISHLGEELTDRLLTHDYIAEIPIEQLIKLQETIPSPGGGIPWAKYLEAQNNQPS
jgi:hypothetical protein